ncbi:hypothetical protein N7510_002691 [Penicillium lagena]|uniref:uncharacterized protein n=1 Tax=Penicillium lagena TaxID=94218 RepID=UPI0025405D7C|nr:uncharacterized protein N7510_002691 [Penicillium lagena]KAJ5626382.1 hypothetical protein N7510_002691 [Penicillium lagena]
MTKPSNEKRMRLRKQCREALAAHIYDRLGLAVAPGMVRLQPQPEDGYSWSVTKSNATLLKSSLSTGTISLYQSICNELGRSLEAVPPQMLQDSQPNASDLSEEGRVNRQRNANGSFTEKICELEASNLQQGVELDRSRTRLNESLCDVHRLQAEVSQLRHEMQTIASQNDFMRDELAQTRTGIAGAIQTLSTLQTQGDEIAFDDIRDCQSTPIDSPMVMNGVGA